MLAAGIGCVAVPLPGVLGGTGPSITIQPLSQTNYVGSPVSFYVSATGTDPLVYQWQKNTTNLTDGGAIFGSTTNTLVFTNLAVADAGSYTVRITNNFGAKTSNIAVLTVYGGIVRNGGFETGEFPPWTLSGNTGGISVNLGTNYAHSGTFGAQLGPFGSPGYLSQALLTSPGASYLLTLWVNSPDGLTPNEFLVAWNGTNLFNQINLGPLGWTNLQFTVTATRSNSVLSLGFRNDPSYFGLDDISVTVLPAPFFLGASSSGTNLSFSWSGQIGFKYQVQYETNLSAPNWSPLGGTVTATNNTLNASDVIAPAPSQRFYRVLLVP